jgi:hypothetical protein
MRTFSYLLSTALLVLAVSLGIAACASIMNGDREEVRIMAFPSGAEITVDGRKRGNDSVECELARGTEHYIDVREDGYRSAHIRTGAGVADWYWGNVVMAFLYSWIDLRSGAAYTVRPNPILVELSPGSGEPMVKTYSESGHWIAALPLEVIGAALAVFFVWFLVGTIHMYNR